jgi:hypothetical protein
LSRVGSEKVAFVEEQRGERRDRWRRGEETVGWMETDGGAQGVGEVAAAIRIGYFC